MIKINLLPFKRKRASTLRKDFRDFLLLLILACVIFFLIDRSIYSDIENTRSNIASAKKEIQSLEPLSSEYLKMQEAKREIQKRIQTLEQLKTGRALTARSLYDLSSLIKEGVWIKTFKKTEGKFEMEGRSFVNESISEFMESLSKLPYMSNVELKNVQDVNEEGLTIKKFIITGNMSI
ncbi:MAG TPA: PilN domain-containing protein [Syntrophorhabdaceae bacterium]|nr:PilN domain-containing protein [Syntrophorhabdaceae bacterium]